MPDSQSAPLNMELSDGCFSTHTSDDAHPGQADLIQQGTKTYYKKQHHSPCLMIYSKEHSLFKPVLNDDNFKFQI